MTELFRVMKRPNLYVWGNWNLIRWLMNWLAVNHPEVNTNLLSWHKTNPVPMCRNKYLNDTEYCLFARGKGVRLNCGYADAKTYWLTPLNTEDKKLWGHPTIKPLPIIDQLIRNSSNEGDVVLDPYLGSGTTAKACRNLNRRFIGAEIDPTFYQTVLRRLEEQ